MPKFTWVTILLSIFITVIVTEVVINKYSLKENPTTIVAKEEEIKIDTNKNEIKEEQPTEAKEEIKIKPETTEPKLLEKSPKVDKTLLASAKVTDPILKKINFNGEFLDLIKLDLDAKYVLQQNIFSGGAYIGSVYEMHFSSPLYAEEQYSNFKEESLKFDFASINENNSFGEKSFYLNNQNKKNTVFVILKTGSDVYGFKYSHSSHATFKSISTFLK